MNSTDLPATDAWTRTTAEALANFDQVHADIPTENWTSADFDAFENLHLAV